MKKTFACVVLAALITVLTACGNKAAGNRERATDTVVGAATDAETSAGQETQGPDQESDSAALPTEESAVQAADETAVPETESGNTETASRKEAADNETDQTEDNTMKITAGDTTFTVTLAENSSVDALKELLAEGPLTIDMSDYGNMEKVGPIGTGLPRNDEQITTRAGDIILYQGNSLVIYYDTNSWNFTRIGKIEGVTGEELLDAFGSGSVTVTFSLE